MPRPRDRHFGEFREHTKLKHLILSTYLKAWGMIMLRFWDRVWFVDAFAGAGKDQTGNPGSPLIAVAIAQELRDEWHAQQPRRSPRLHVVAIEKDHARFEELAENLGAYTDERVDTGVYVREGSLEQYADRMLPHIGKAPAMYFLDPCGVDGLQADLLPKVLAGDHNEVFALFSDTGATRLAGVLTAEDEDVEAAIERGMMQRHLFEDMDSARADELREAAEARSEALTYSQPAAERILTTALGPGNWLAEIEALPVHERPLKFVQLYMQLLVRSGARFVIPLTVYDASARRMYTLIHASKSPKAFEEMKEAMCHGLKYSDLPDEVRQMMMSALQTDLGPVIERIREHFAGREVLWVGETSTESVKTYALQYTPVFPVQLAELRGQLEQLGLRMPGRKIRFTFPSLA